MISFSRVSKSYGGPLKAVEDFSLTVPDGAITVLMGSSGCGKTTLLRMVNRMVTPDSGQVLLDGQDVAAMNPVILRRSIGYVMQEVGLLPHKTILRNVVLTAHISGQEKHEALSNAHQALERVGIKKSQFDLYPHQLSGGQQQRVGVARALAIHPRILLMDEPFGAVDPILREDLQMQLREIQQELNLTVFLVTHDRNEALSLADQLVILSTQAQIEQAGTPEEIRKRPHSDFVRKILGLAT